MKDKIPYIGSKAGSGIYQTIINHIPAHKVYYELFGGSAAIGKKLYACRPDSRYKIYDIDEKTVERYLAHKDNFVYTVGDAFEILEILIGSGLKDIFVYMDPPYIISSRRSGAKHYRHEFEEADHIELLNYATRAKFPMMISGYESELYNEYLHTWRKISMTVATHRGIAQEIIWMNYDARELELHTYEFLGKDFTDRQRIKRRKNDLLAKFRKIDFHERKFLLQSLEQEFKK